MIKIHKAFYATLFSVLLITSCAPLPTMQDGRVLEKNEIEAISSITLTDWQNAFAFDIDEDDALLSSLPVLNPHYALENLLQV